MTRDEYKMLNNIIETEPIPFADFEKEFLQSAEPIRVFESLVDYGFVTIKSESDTILDTDLIRSSYRGRLEFQRYKSSEKDSFNKWLVRSFFSGILVGVITTVLAEYLLNLVLL